MSQSSSESSVQLDIQQTTGMKEAEMIQIKGGLRESVIVSPPDYLGIYHFHIFV